MQLPIRPPTKKLVAIVLADYATEKNKTGVSTEGIQNATGMTQAQIEYAVQGLVDDGRIIDTGKRIGEQNEIRVFQLMINKPLEKIKRRANATPPEFAEAEIIYRIYPRPVSKPKSLISISKAIQKYGFETVKQKTEMFAALWKGQPDLNLFCPHSCTWFNQERFNDSPETWSRSVKPKQISNGPKFTEVKKYIADKGINDDRGWCSSFFNYWSDPKRNWQRDGKNIDWQIELSKNLAKWRAALPQPETPQSHSS